jgi:hypothetical protein
MSHTHQQTLGGNQYRRLFVLGTVLLGVFAVYAPAVQLMAFGADISLLRLLNNLSFAHIFTGAYTQTNPYSPLSLMLWQIAKATSGFPAPALLHFWNVWLHTFNVALLAALAWRLAKLFDLNQLLFTLLSILIFGLFPFSYEAVLWAAAVNHLLMTAFGLSAILVYLTVRHSCLARPARIMRLVLSGFLLLAANLSHEMGFIFGSVLLLIEVAYALKEHHWSHNVALALFAWSLLYPIAHQFFSRAVWSSQMMPGLWSNTSAWYPNALIQAQGMLAWAIILLRNMIGLPESREWIVLVVFVVATGIVLVGLWYVRRLRAGMLALTLWLIALLPSTLLLSQAYMSHSPRLLYEPSIGVALFWACAITCVVNAIRWPLIRLMILGCAGIILVWSAVYVAFQRDQVARLSPAFQLINADLQHSNPADMVLLVNMPQWEAPVTPSFLLGTQGMDFSQQGGDSASDWLFSVSGVYRKTSSVRRVPAVTGGKQMTYGVSGTPVDDAGLLAQLLQANYSYRFEYSSPGLRISRLAMIGFDQTRTPPLAKFTNGDTQAALRLARATLCGKSVAMELTWSDVRRMNFPTGVFVHVIDVQNRQAVVADSDLIGGYLPLDQVPMGMVVTETRKIDIPASFAPPKQVELGAYIRAGQVRMSAVNADGGQWEDDAVIVPIEDDNPELCRRIGE